MQVLIYGVKLLSEHMETFLYFGVKIFKIGVVLLDKIEQVYWTEERKVDATCGGGGARKSDTFLKANWRATGNKHCLFRPWRWSQ